MIDLPQAERHLLFLQAVRGLADEASSAAAAAPFASDEWNFYSGVRRAAEDLLHADAMGIRLGQLGWLDHETPPFRDGYLEAEARLTAAMTASEPPVRIGAPSFRGAAAL